MKVVNPHSVLQSVAEALNPGVSLIDGRTEQDWLRFLSEFATLINFYDQDNTVQGNWEPFILKDPVFLMAAIAGTNFTKIYNLYLHTCKKLERLLLPELNLKDLAVSFNQLFDQLTGVFVRIKNWMYYMYQSAIVYPLKTYVEQQIRDTFANAFHAIISLRQDIFSAAMLVGLNPVDSGVTAKFEVYNVRIWKEGAFKGPYWKLMGLLHPIKENTLTAIFKALTGIGDALFDFVQVVIRQAHTEYEHLIKLKGHFPDTTLLRAFVHLLKVQQEQLNQLSNKHLNFYYRDILKQAEKKAVADRAYLIATLANKTEVFKLPKGTLFDAGLDAQKNQVVFASTDDAVLNPATIPMAYTLARSPATDQLSFLQLNTIANPGVVQQGSDGKILSWDTLGSHRPDPTTQKPLGIAFASPMFLLREGARQITITLNYTGTLDLDMFKKAGCFLSTLTDWLEVSADFQLDTTTADQVLQINISLKSTDPAIERFLINPDGFESQWPMFKLVFNQVTLATVAPPILHSMKIDVDVSGMESLQLYNDYGALSTKVAYPPFGPTPELGSNFIIGSDEIFSKPVNDFKLTLDWSALPPDFAIYYQSYNLYLNNQFSISPVQDPSFWDKIFGHKQPDPTPLPVESGPFNNSCFVVDFQLLKEKGWVDVPFTTGQANGNSTAVSTTVTSTAESTNLLFTNDNGEKPSYSIYGSTSIPLNACDPELQNQPLKFTELSTGGFIKMELKGPVYGFGATVYPNVVSAIALYNSQILYNKEDVAFATAAQLPFTPKLKNLSACYQSTVQYVFDAADQTAETLNDYPVQAFWYTPFANYMVYDNLDQPAVQNYTIGDINQDFTSGISLYISLKYDGYLYLEVDSLVPASSFNIYFEMARKYIMGAPVAAQVGYYYLGTEGWAALTVTADGTDNLSSSGIVTLNIPENITLSSKLMPPKFYWIAVAANNTAQVANTILLSTNGITVQRVNPTSTDSVNVPQIVANTIKKAKNPLPNITTLQQPFPSFGGKVAENAPAMNWRVSNRIKTKDRAATGSDYIRLVKQQFNSIYDALVIYDRALQCTNIYVVKAIESWKTAGAFFPLVGVGEEEQISIYLTQRSAAFSVIKVSNPDFQSVSVYASITIQQGYEITGVQQQLMQALNLYLSPWIRTDSVQVEIYADITDVQVAAFIKTQPGVANVETLYFKTWMYVPGIAEAPATAVAQSKVQRLQPSALFVSGMVHQITINPVVV